MLEQRPEGREMERLGRAPSSPGGRAPWPTAHKGQRPCGRTLIGGLEEWSRGCGCWSRGRRGRKMGAEVREAGQEDGSGRS